MLVWRYMKFLSLVFFVFIRDWILIFAKSLSQSRSWVVFKGKNVIWHEIPLIYSLFRCVESLMVVVVAGRLGVVSLLTDVNAPLLLPAGAIAVCWSIAHWIEFTLCRSIEKEKEGWGWWNWLARAASKHLCLGLWEFIPTRPPLCSILPLLSSS